jgi:hypothetical protein
VTLQDSVFLWLLLSKPREDLVEKETRTTSTMNRIYESPAKKREQFIPERKWSQESIQREREREREKFYFAGEARRRRRKPLEKKRHQGSQGQEN